MRLGSLLLLVLVSSSCIRDFDRSLIDEGCPSCEIVSLGLSGTSTCAVHRDGRMWCFGSSELSQIPVPGSPARTPPIRVGEAIWSRVMLAARTEVHGCGIDMEGALYCWGDAGDGQIGNGQDEGEVSEPAPVAPGERFVAVDGGRAFTCGIRDDGALFCWGWTAYDQLGFVDGSYVTTPGRVPVTATMRSLSVGGRHSCAIDDEAGLWCWGDTGSGKLGRGGPGGPPMPTDGDNRYQRVAAGEEHTCGIRVDGSLWCWGDNTMGQLGREGVGGVTPTRVGERDDWQQVSAGEAFTCAITRGSELYCWGDNDFSQLGRGDAPATSIPTRVGERNDWSLIQLGSVHACGATEDGTLHCWGSGGQRMNGFDGTVETPTPVLLP